MKLSVIMFQKLGKHQMNFNKDVINKYIQVYCVQ